MPIITSLNGEWTFTRTHLSTVLKKSTPIKNPKSRRIHVPANWYLEGEDFAGQADYETQFHISKLYENEIIFLRFKGADYFLKAWVNGHGIGSHEGYFQTFEWNMTKYLNPGANHLKVTVESPKENLKDWPHNKYLIKGIFNHHDARPGSWDKHYGQDRNTGGLWGDVELVKVTETFLRQVQISSTVLDSKKAVVHFKIHLTHFAPAGNYALKTSIQGAQFDFKRDHKQTIYLHPGDNQICFSITLPQPRLWWTWDHGQPYLYQASLELQNCQTGKIVEQGQERFGIRKIEVTPDWKFILNNRQIFVRGTNIIPTQFLSEYGPQAVQRDIQLMREAHLNAVRVHAHVNRKCFYDACDQAGIFVWQDFALQWSYQRSDAFIANACRQIKEMVRQFYNHPSILVWCCHNEPSVNREELDPILEKAVREEDATRYVDVASDFHYHPYPGWYWEADVLRDPSGTLSSNTTFFSEFGAQALPQLSTLKTMFSKKELWPPAFEKWTYHDFQFFQTFNVAHISMGKSIEEFIGNSQRYQAQLIRDYIISFRLKKYQAFNGFFQFMFVDCWPAITWSVVDYFRNPKLGYEALKMVCQPILPVWRKSVRQFNPKDVLNWGDSFLRELMIVNDLPRSFKNIKVIIQVMNPRKKVIYQENARCSLEADCVARPFAHYEKGFHQTNFSLPEKALLGTYTVWIKLFDGHGKVLSSNCENFEVISKQQSVLGRSIM